MEIAHKNKTIIINFIIGTVWTILGITYFFESRNSQWKPILTCVVGLLYFLMAAYEYINKYIIITHQQITVNTLPKKHINLDEIISADYHTNNYTFSTSDKTLKVVASRIDPKDLPKFDIFFNEIKSKLMNTDPLLSHERK
ncbi:hypothetical protein [Chryseobacterium sp.]|uniref:hypothetical protein n=1 Tax=Chryseobacterium sp. TaxID=1871047 RepID=UPI0025C69D8B|nr:hypothetical protein [Chryseobacterium sp.]MBV8328593.1 hypothetical protein [Chryseobacterium sp.]